MNKHRLIGAGSVVFAVLLVLGLARIIEDHSDRAAQRWQKRAVNAEARIEEACRQASWRAELTLRALNMDHDRGLDLAMRVAADTILCGGDARAISTPVLRNDRDATFKAVLAQYDAWCPTCRHRDDPKESDPKESGNP